jgi:hypothetical protein
VIIASVIELYIGGSVAILPRFEEIFALFAEEKITQIVGMYDYLTFCRVTPVPLVTVSMDRIRLYLPPMLQVDYTK